MHAQPKNDVMSVLAMLVNGLYGTPDDVPFEAPGAAESPLGLHMLLFSPPVGCSVSTFVASLGLDGSVGGLAEPFP